MRRASVERKFQNEHLQFSGLIPEATTSTLTSTMTERITIRIPNYDWRFHLITPGCSLILQYINLLRPCRIRPLAFIQVLQWKDNSAGQVNPRKSCILSWFEFESKNLLTHQMVIFWAKIILKSRFWSWRSSDSRI